MRALSKPTVASTAQGFATITFTNRAHRFPETPSAASISTQSSLAMISPPQPGVAVVVQGRTFRRVAVEAVGGLAPITLETAN